MESLPESLTEEQAVERYKQHGSNDLPSSKSLSFFARSWKFLKEPMLLLLVSAASVYLIIGDLSEGIMLGTSVFVVIGISLYQDRKSEKALFALRQLSSPRALVIRNGVERRIPASLLVPGDLIALHEGDRVPADGKILRASNLGVDESLLTGESFPVQKAAHDNMFSSTLIISGSTLVRVLRTGTSTEVGKIGTSLLQEEPEELNLRKETRQMVRLFAWMGAILCLAMIILYGTSKGNWPQALLVGLATAMALLPEEFPVVLTVFLAMGAWRLSKLQVLVRNPGAIERLGAISVLCVDKTGTLTQNKMGVAELYNSKTSVEVQSKPNLSRDFYEISEFALLASRVDPFDPTEKAIHNLFNEGVSESNQFHNDWKFIREYPLSEKLLAMSCAWKKPDALGYVIATKGAPEAIIHLCQLGGDQEKRAQAAVRAMAERGLRVLGVARSSVPDEKLPDEQSSFRFQWLGLIGLEDPLRAEVPSAVQICKSAGIRVMMMTGDHPSTASKIALKAGIPSSPLITGAELSKLSDSELSEQLKSVHVFARMIPEQKLRIVKLLKEQGHIVGMTGDGVNDAPSLKWADVGIAMGERGTDVAREASDIVLLDDNFASIVSGIERGRLIYNNIKKAMSYIVSIHIPIAGLSILPLLLNWPLILLPVHIVFLELIIDPACTLMFESQPSETRVMHSPPRALGLRFFSAKDLLRSSLQGLLVLFAVILLLKFGSQASAERTRALAFVVLTMSNIGLIFADMSGGSFRHLTATFRKVSNPILLLGVVSVLYWITHGVGIRSLFHFDPLSPLEFVVTVGIGFAVFAILSVWNWRAALAPSSTMPFTRLQ
ncbi:cation-translocating P-type ATPase [bacterium]|nr:cation-translocating P-type ATPase [bacterium]